MRGRRSKGMHGPARGLAVLDDRVVVPDATDGQHGDRRGEVPPSEQFHGSFAADAQHLGELGQRDDRRRRTHARTVRRCRVDKVYARGVFYSGRAVSKLVVRGPVCSRSWSFIRFCRARSSDQVDFVTELGEWCTVCSLPRCGGTTASWGTTSMVRGPVRMLTAVVAACAVATGCTNASGVTTQNVDPPSTSSEAVSPTAAPTPSPTAPATISSSTAPIDTSTPTHQPTDGVPAAEAADRAAVQEQWIKSWDVYLDIARVPSAERDQLIATVAVDPAKSNMLEDAAKFDSQGLETYGDIEHRISWPQPIDGADTALIDDCQDASQTGSIRTSTGEKVTVGVPRDHHQGTLIRGSDGVWRVSQVFYLEDEPC
jgi:hypothetical protein